jgi:hypothetical protein
VSARGALPDRELRSGRRATPFAIALWLTAFIGAFYGGVLFRGEQFAYRDAGHFYYPLYARVRAEWAAGKLPLWEPGENGGAPVLGTPMAAALYPPNVLLSWLPYGWGSRLYTVGHEILAFASMAVLLRAWGTSATGAMLGGLSYAFGGVVLSGYFNIIYLVGASWLPLGFRALDSWLRMGRRLALVGLVLVLSMQVVGGDPESAYLTVLCALGYAVGLARSEGGAVLRPWLWTAVLFTGAAAWLGVSPYLASWLFRTAGWSGQVALLLAWILAVCLYAASRPGGERRRLGAMLLGLAGAGAFALLLVAASVLPVLDQLGTSVRWTGSGPAGLYDSSLLPYRAIEWIWPNVFGTFVAGNHYWMSLLPPLGAERPSPLSLYQGALPLALALAALGFRGGPPWRAWLTCVALASFWASLGEFAGISRWVPGRASAASGDETLYGLLATVLPGFRLFRFPFKLLALTSLGLSALAGLGWDLLAAASFRRRVIAVLVALLALSVLSGSVVAGLHDRLAGVIASSPRSAHGVYGPFDAKGAVGELLRGVGHGAAALALSLLIIGWALPVREEPRLGWTGKSVLRTGARRTSRPDSSLDEGGILPEAPVTHANAAGSRANMAALVLLFVDLGLANASLVITVPQADFEREPAVVRAIRAAERADPTPGAFRVHRLAQWVPIGWSQTASNTRLRELVDWEIDTVQPGFGLLHGIQYVLTDESETGSAVYRRLFEPAFRLAGALEAAVLGVEPGQRVLHHPRAAIDLWGARYFIIPAFPGDWTGDNRSYAAFLAETDVIYPDVAALARPGSQRDRQAWLMTQDVQVRRNRSAFPRAWVVHTARAIQPRDALQPAVRDALIVRLRAGGKPIARDAGIPETDLRNAAYVETADPASVARYSPGGAAGPGETAVVRYDTATRAVIEVRLDRPGIVVLADRFDTGWRLTIDGRPAPVLRANLLMRAAAVGAGAHTLVYTYEPMPARFGLGISASSLVILITLAAWTRRRPLAHWAERGSADSNRQLPAVR